MLFIGAFFFNFLIGGFTGVFLSDVPSDFTLHASYFVQAHFHYTIMGSEVFALMGAIVYFLPKMTGFTMDTKLLKFQFWAVFLTFNGTFISLIAVGILGMTRRTISYASYLQPLNVSASVFAFGLGASMALFLGILIGKPSSRGLGLSRIPGSRLGSSGRCRLRSRCSISTGCQRPGRSRMTTTPANQPRILVRPHLR